MYEANRELITYIASFYVGEEMRGVRSFVTLEGVYTAVREWEAGGEEFRATWKEIRQPRKLRATKGKPLENNNGL